MTKSLFWGKWKLVMITLTKHWTRFSALFHTVYVLKIASSTSGKLAHVISSRGSAKVIQQRKAFFTFSNLFINRNELLASLSGLGQRRNFFCRDNIFYISIPKTHFLSTYDINANSLPILRSSFFEYKHTSMTYQWLNSINLRACYHIGTQFQSIIRIYGTSTRRKTKYRWWLQV